MLIVEIILGYGPNPWIILSYGSNPWVLQYRGGMWLEHGLPVGKRQGKNDFVINVLYGLSVVLSTWEGDLT